VIRLRDAQLRQPSSSCGTARRYPLHRWHRACRRAKVHIPVSTLSDWVAGVADRPVLLAEVLEVRVLSSYVVGTDATGLKVLEPCAKENIHFGPAAARCSRFSGTAETSPRGSGFSPEKLLQFLSRKSDVLEN
jgi:hypothetical protein